MGFCIGVTSHNGEPMDKSWVVTPLKIEMFETEGEHIQYSTDTKLEEDKNTTHKYNKTDGTS